MEESFIAKVGERGQVTIPRQLREALEISGNDYMLFKLNKDGSIKITKAEIKSGGAEEKDKKKSK